MNHGELINKIIEENAPKSGMMYALYKDRVVYHPYCVARADANGEEKRIILAEDTNLANNLLELHLFDAVKEYRLVFRRNMTSVSKIIDDSCMDTENGSFKYIEEQIETFDIGDPSNRGLVNIVNYVTYDEDDILYIENYRLMEVR